MKIKNKITIILTLTTAIISTTFCAEQEEPDTNAKDLLAMVHKCPGLRDMSKNNLAPLVFSDKVRKSCPALAPWYNSLPHTNKCIAREVAVQTGDDPRTWGEALFAGSGCYKVSSNRKEAAACNRNPDLRRKLTLMWCLDQKPKTHTKR